MTPRYDTLVTVLAILVIVIALPFGSLDTIKTGCDYIFSRQSLEALLQRFTGTGRFRLPLQPSVAIVVVGISECLADV